MSGRRILVLTLVALVVASGAAALVAAQDGAQATQPPSEGYLFLTAEEVGQFRSPEDDLCYEEGHARVRNVTTSVPTDPEPSKVKVGRSAAAVSCLAFFNHEVRQGFTLGPEAAFTVWAYCDTPFAGVNRPPEAGDDYRIIIWHNEEIIVEAPGEYPYEPAAACPGEALMFTPLRLDLTFPVPPTPFNPGDELQIGVVLFGHPDLTESLYLLVDSRTYPSALHGVGIPGPLRSAPTSNLVVEAPTMGGFVGPGNATTYPVKLTNLGSSGAELRVVVSGPGEGWAAVAPEPVVHVASNQTRGVPVLVAAPPDASPGAEVQHRVTVRSASEEVTFTTTTQLVPDTGTPASERLTPAQLPAEFYAAAGSADADAVSLRGMLAELWQEIVAGLVVAVLGGLLALLRG